MSTGSLLIIVSTVVLTILGIVVFLPVYMKGSLLSMRRRNRELHEQSLRISRNIKSIDRTITRSLQNWPIWPRPVLYTTIDTQIQRNAASLLNILEAAQLCVVQTESSLNTNIESDLNSRFPFVLFWNFRDLIKRNEEELQALLGFEAQATELKNILLACQNEIERLELRIRNDLSGWQQRAKDYQFGIQADGKENTAEFLRSSKSIEGMKQAVVAGQDCIKQNLTADHIRYARTEICNRTALGYWRHLTLNSKILNQPDNYDIDQSNDLLDQAEPILLTVLINVRLDEWIALAKVKRELQRAHSTIALAEAKFSDFQKNLTSLQQELASINEIEPEHLIKVASAQEEKLNLLWHDYPEWDRLLQGVQEPSRQLQNVRATWEGRIYPKISGEELIRQTDLENLVNEIFAFHKKLIRIQGMIGRISEEIRGQESARERIKELLSASSPMWRNLSQLVRSKDDASEDISIRTTAYETFFQTYRAKIEKHQGPNFVRLESDVRVLEQDCSDTLREHNEILGQRRTDGKIILQKVLKTFNGLALIFEGPYLKAEGNWNAIKKTKTKLEQEFSIVENSFPKLGEFIQKARIIQQDWSQLLFVLQQRKSAFFNAMSEQRRQIALREEKANSDLAFVQNQGWSNLLGEQYAAILKCQNDYKRIAQVLNSLRNEQWITEAERKCSLITDALISVEKQISFSANEARKTSLYVERKRKAALATIDPFFRNVVEQRLNELLSNLRDPLQVENLFKRVKNRDWSYLNISINRVDRSNINITGDGDINQQIQG